MVICLGHIMNFIKSDGDQLQKVKAVEGYKEGFKGWQKLGIPLENRHLNIGDTGLILLDSATSGVPEETKEWLQRLANKHQHQLLFTHACAPQHSSNQSIYSFC